MNNFSHSYQDFNGFTLSSFQLSLVKPQIWMNYPPTQYWHKAVGESHKTCTVAPLSILALYPAPPPSTNTPAPPQHLSAFLAPSTSEETEVTREKLSLSSITSPPKSQTAWAACSGTAAHLFLAFTHHFQVTWQVQDMY